MGFYIINHEEVGTTRYLCQSRPLSLSSSFLSLLHERGCVRKPPPSPLPPLLSLSIVFHSSSSSRRLLLGCHKASLSFSLSLPLSLSLLLSSPLLFPSPSPSSYLFLAFVSLGVFRKCFTLISSSFSNLSGLSLKSLSLSHPNSFHSLRIIALFSYLDASSSPTQEQQHEGGRVYAQMDFVGWTFLCQR